MPQPSTKSNTAAVANHDGRTYKPRYKNLRDAYEEFKALKGAKRDGIRNRNKRAMNSQQETERGGGEGGAGMVPHNVPLQAKRSSKIEKERYISILDVKEDDEAADYRDG